MPNLAAKSAKVHEILYKFTKEKLFLGLLTPELCKLVMIYAN